MVTRRLKRNSIVLQFKKKRNYTSKSMCVCFSEEEIMEETKTCYVKLYNQQETVDVNLKISAPLLTMEDREISEG